MTKLFRRN